MFLEVFDKPWYVLRPRQLLRRWTPSGPRSRTLWGQDLELTDDVLGGAVRRMGIFDLVVSEVLFRLAGPGETVVDAGANIGHMSGVLATAVGPTGRVLAYEPNPQVLDILRRNVATFAKDHRLGRVVVRANALSSRRSVAPFALASEDNLGTGTLSGSDNSARSVSVETIRLDESLGDERPNLMKIDVEGHELAVLEGAGDFVGPDGIRDLVVEAHEGLGGSVAAFLGERGYALFALHRNFAGPIARSGASDGPPRFESLSLLATTQPDRAASRLEPRGWRILRPGPL